MPPDSTRTGSAAVDWYEGHAFWAEPPDHRTGSARLETGEACQRTSHSPQPPCTAGEWGGRDQIRDWAVCVEKRTAVLQQRKPEAKHSTEGTSASVFSMPNPVDPQDTHSVSETERQKHDV